LEILFKALSKVDLNREIIISEHAKIWIEELDIEMPKLKKA
jgi:C4-type Zn-finger protein